MRRRTILSVLFLGACRSPAAPPAAGGGGSTHTSGPSTSGTSTSSRPGTTSGSPTSTSASADASTEGEADSRLFIVDDWDVPPWIECSTWEDECPRGEKCSAYAYDGGGFWNALRCFPVVPAPAGLGEPCTVEGSGVSGLDSCEAGTMCWDVDGVTGEGTCRGFCQGDIYRPVCADPWARCFVGSEGALSLCLPRCSPLDPTTCPEDEFCRVAATDAWCTSEYPEVGGAAFESCSPPYECQPGLYCGPSESVGACLDPDSDDCCTSHCDVEAPDCPESLSCIPVFAPDVMPPGLANIGYCGQEPR